MKNTYFTKFKNIFNYFLSIVLISIAFTSNVHANGYYPKENEERAHIHYSGIDYKEYDVQIIYDLLERLDKLSESKSKKSSGSTKDSDINDEIISIYEEILTEYDKFITSCDINNLRYYHDVNNEEYSAIETKLSSISTDLLNSICLGIQKSLKSAYGASLSEHIADEETVESFLSYESMTDRERELYLSSFGWHKLVEAN